jgi:hypothetical protein
VTTTMLPSVEDMRRWWWHGPWMISHACAHEATVGRQMLCL